KSTGLVREASALDATIFNAVFSAPVGATLAWGVFFALSAFPGSDLVTATIISFVLNVPVLLMMGLLASSMPRTGGDYVWASLIAGTRTTFRWQNTFWIIASVGTFLAFIVLLFGSTDTFKQHFNDLSAQFGAHGDAYQAVIDKVKGSIATSPQPGNLSVTVPSIFVIMVFMMWNWWSVYLSGELKSASNRNRQLGIMFGALAWDVIFIVIGVLLIFKVAGY